MLWAPKKKTYFYSNSSDPSFYSRLSTSCSLTALVGNFVGNFVSWKKNSFIEKRNTVAPPTQKELFRAVEGYEDIEKSPLSFPSTKREKSFIAACPSATETDEVGTRIKA